MLAMIFASAIMNATPLALRVEVQPLGSGPQHATVVGVALQVAPEDLKRAGERLRVALTLSQGGKVVDTSDAVVELAADGSALLYREWPTGEGELQVEVESGDGKVRGGWVGKVVIPVGEKPFQAVPGGPPDALALAPEPPATGVLRFKPPAQAAGLGAVELEVEAPDGTAKVEFTADGQALVQRNRPPWTVSVPLGQVAKRTTVKAVAFASDGSFLGEDAVVLNGATGQIPVEILIAPSLKSGAREVTVSVGATAVNEVVLRADDHAIERWTSCPCVARVPETALKTVKVLSAEATGRGGMRGEAVKVLGSEGFSESVRVEVVELPVTVVDKQGRLIKDLPREAFQVREDGREVPLESFATTEELPLALGILVDTSGSMREEFPAVRKAVSGFATNLLRAGDRYFLMTFAFEPAMQINWATDSQGLASSLERIVPEGGTSIHDTLVRALEEFRGRTGRSALVLLTDGDDTTSRTTWDVALRYAKTVRVPIFTIGFRIGKLDFLVRKRLAELAQATGAEVFFAPNQGVLADTYRHIDEQLRAQYLLTYRSPSAKNPDLFRTVQVAVRNEGMTARTIAGYFPSQ
ncbi:MAG: VWA domain-containing protein [Thermoanaerobaculales bacterium]